MEAWLPLLVSNLNSPGGFLTHSLTVFDCKASSLSSFLPFTKSQVLLMDLQPLLYSFPSAVLLKAYDPALSMIESDHHPLRPFPTVLGHCPSKSRQLSAIRPSPAASIPTITTKNFFLTLTSCFGSNSFTGPPKMGSTQSWARTRVYSTSRVKASLVATPQEISLLIHTV
jgi:hypothetical protein